MCWTCEALTPRKAPQEEVVTFKLVEFGVDSEASYVKKK